MFKDPETSAGPLLFKEHSCKPPVSHDAKSLQTLQSQRGANVCTNCGCCRACTFRHSELYFTNSRRNRVTDRQSESVKCKRLRYDRQQAFWKEEQIGRTGCQNLCGLKCISLWVPVWIWWSALRPDWRLSQSCCLVPSGMVQTRQEASVQTANHKEPGQLTATHATATLAYSILHCMQVSVVSNIRYLIFPYFFLPHVHKVFSSSRRVVDKRQVVFSRSWSLTFQQIKSQSVEIHTDGTHMEQTWTQFHTKKKKERKLEELKAKRTAMNQQIHSWSNQIPNEDLVDLSTAALIRKSHKDSRPCCIQELLGARQCKYYLSNCYFNNARNDIKKQMDLKTCSSLKHLTYVLTFLKSSIIISHYFSGHFVRPKWNNSTSEENHFVHQLTEKWWISAAKK